MGSRIPSTTKAVVVQKCAAQQKSVYHDAVLVTKPIPLLKPGEVLVKLAAAAFNHRDVWIRKGQYPRIVMGSTFGADGAGTVVAAYDPNDPLLHKRVFLTPMRGWERHPDAPESDFGILGGGSLPPLGTFSEYLAVGRYQLIPTPAHLTDIQMAAWPLGGITAWRAVHVYAQVKPGQNVLITGIGGGVAIIALQICLAKGASVYVTSGSEEKIRRAVTLGAKGGANYKNKQWPAQIGTLLNDGDLDCVIDSGGGDIINQTGKYLKHGGKVVCYGMTASPVIAFTMRQVMKNQQLIGSMMGSHQDLKDATKFLEEHRITPVVSHVLRGLEAAEEGFELIKRGDQFGKVVIEISASGSQDRAKL